MHSSEIHTPARPRPRGHFDHIAAWCPLTSSQECPRRPSGLPARLPVLVPWPVPSPGSRGWYPVMDPSWGPHCPVRQASLWFAFNAITWSTTGFFISGSLCRLYISWAQRFYFFSSTSSAGKVPGLTGGTPEMFTELMRESRTAALTQTAFP